MVWDKSQWTFTIGLILILSAGVWGGITISKEKLVGLDYQGDTQNKKIISPFIKFCEDIGMEMIGMEVVGTISFMVFPEKGCVDEFGEIHRYNTFFNGTHWGIGNRIYEVEYQK